MTLRTGKEGRYRYYTCSTKARQGETGCLGRTAPMESLTRSLPITSSAACGSRRALGKSYRPCLIAGSNALSTEQPISLPCASARPKQTDRLGPAITRGPSRRSPGRAAGACGPSRVAIAATTPARSPSASKSIRMTYHRVEERAATHPRRRFKRENSGFWPAQFCTEVAHPERFERPIPNSSFADWLRAQPSSHDASRRPGIVGRCRQDGMLGIPSRKQLAPSVRSRRERR
jgi:hypothetical protein